MSALENTDVFFDFLQFLDGVKQTELPALSSPAKSRIYNKGWIDALELNNLVHLLEAAARCALARKESRGVHYRTDFPDTDNESWLKESVVRLDNGSMRVDYRDVTATVMTPPSGIVPYLEMLKRMMAAHSDIKGGH